MMENKIKNAFEHATPDVFDTIANDIRNSEGKVVLMTKKKNNWWKKGLAIAAAFAVVITGLYVLNDTKNQTASDDITVVSLDVNPSVEIRVQKDNVVKEVVALNEDGKKIVDDMDFAGSKLDVALNALVGSMVKNGYLSELSNSILVSVDGADDARNAELQEWVSAEIAEILGGNDVDSAVLSQTVAENDELKKLAETYGISLGKAQLITEIAEKNTRYTVADLAGLTINELNLLSEGKGQHVDHVTASGTASSKAYIGADEAKTIALKHAGVEENDARGLEVDLEMEVGVMIYEIDFETQEYEFEYAIDATTGKVLHNHKDPRDYDDIYDDDYHDDVHHDNGVTTQTPTTTTPATGDIGREEAKNIALNHAGVKESNARDLEVERDQELGVTVYEVSFEAGGYEYDYEINAETGKILKSEKERD